MKLKTITWDYFSKHNPCYDPQDSYGDFSGTILDILKDERTRRTIEIDYISG